MVSSFFPRLVDNEIDALYKVVIDQEVKEALFVGIAKKPI